MRSPTKRTAPAEGAERAVAGAEPSDDQAGGARPEKRRKRYEPPAGKKVGATAFELWFEEAWHGWLKMAAAVVAVGLLALLYSADVLPERFVATLMAVLLIGGPIVYASADLWARTENRPRVWRGVVVAFVALWAIAASYPAGSAIIPPHDVATATLTKDKTVHLDASALGGAPIELEVKGTLQGSSGEADGKVTLQIVSNGVTEQANAEFDRHSNYMRVGRRGSGQVTTEKTIDKVPLSLVRGSKDVAVSIPYQDQIVNPPIDIAIHRRPYPVAWLIALGLILVAFGMLLDGRLADRESSYAAMWVCGTMVFSLSLWQYSDPTSLVRPAIGALLTAGFAGLSSGALLSWLGDKLFRPASLRKRKRK